MTERPRRVPSAEEEALWRRRFGLFALLRLTGLGLMFLGVVIAMTGLVRPSGVGLLGWPLAAAGLAWAIVAPRLLRRRWTRE